MDTCAPVAVQDDIRALEARVAEARGEAQQQPVACLVETDWRQGQHRAWLWTAVTASVPVFVVRLSRRGKVAQELLGEQFWGDWSRTAGGGYSQCATLPTPDHPTEPLHPAA